MIAERPAVFCFLHGQNEYIVLSGPLLNEQKQLVDVLKRFCGVRVQFAYTLRRNTETFSDVKSILTRTCIAKNNARAFSAGVVGIIGFRNACNG